jgi:hypothetical protein
LDLRKRRLDLRRQHFLEVGLERAAGDREGQVDADPRLIDFDALDHAELDDAAVQLRVVDCGEDISYLLNGGHAPRVTHD